MMNLRDHPTIVILTLVVAVGAATFSAGYSMRTDRIAELQARIDAYKVENDLKLRDLLASLTRASDALRKDVETANQLAAQKEENARLKKTNEEITGKFNALQVIKSQLEAELKAKEELLKGFYLNSLKFTLNNGASKTLPGTSVIVGLVDTHPTYSEVMFNNEKNKMEPGAVKTTTVDDRTYVLVLDKMDYIKSSVDFSVLVKKK